MSGQNAEPATSRVADFGRQGTNRCCRRRVLPPSCVFVGFKRQVVLKPPAAEELTSDRRAAFAAVHQRRPNLVSFIHPGAGLAAARRGDTTTPDARAAASAMK